MEEEHNGTTLQLPCFFKDTPSHYFFFFFFVLLPTSEQKGVLDVTQQKATFGFFSLLIKSAVSGLSKPLFNLQKCTPNDTAVHCRRLVRQESLT